MIPCGGAKVNRIAGFFRAWRGVFAGACPSAPCVVSGAQGMACFLCRLPTLPLACFLSPIPPPALAERSSPPGKGETFSFLMQGASPLASPGLNPGGIYSPSKTGTQRRACPCVAGGGGRWRCPRGGVLSLSPAYPAFSLLSFPHPPDPLPLRGRGRLLVFLCKGLRPLHPRG